MTSEAGKALPGGRPLSLWETVKARDAVIARKVQAEAELDRQWLAEMYPVEVKHKNWLDKVLRGRFSSR